MQKQTLELESKVNPSPRYEFPETEVAYLAQIMETL